MNGRNMDKPNPGTKDWLDQVVEPVLDPSREIIDPHHHLWDFAFGNRYLIEELMQDTGSGHNIIKTVYVECGSFYNETGPKHLRPVGETTTVAKIANGISENNPKIAGIVARADLTLGEKVEDVLNAHQKAGGSLFKGIRHAGASALDSDNLIIKGRAPKDLYSNINFRRGLKRLGILGYTYDTWHYHYQNRDFLSLARATPETILVLNHFGTPLGVGRYSSEKKSIFDQWKKDIKDIAECPNVMAKLGGLAMPDNGYGWHEAKKPPDSKSFAEAQKHYYLHAIEVFGPERCMFESNFPVDKLSISYPVLWNGLKRIASQFTDKEQDKMFSGTASRVYGLN